MPRKEPTVATSGPRRAFLQSTLRSTIISGASIALYPALGAAREFSKAGAQTPKSFPTMKQFELDEITVADLQDGMKSGKFTARSLVEKYQARIAEIDKDGPAINSIIELNPDVLAIADALVE